MMTWYWILGSKFLRIRSSKTFGYSSRPFGNLLIRICAGSLVKFVMACRSV